MANWAIHSPHADSWTAASGGGGGANTWYAATNGVSSNNGAIGTPWDLQTALNGGNPANSVKPGDTVFCRGGTYTGQYVANVFGSSGKPVTFKFYTGEQPTIDGYVSTTLTGSMTAGQTTVPMTKIQVPDNTVIDIGTEAIRIHTAYSAGSYTGVDRGWNGTTATTHSTNDQVIVDGGACFGFGSSSYFWFWGFECKVGTSRYTNRVNPQAGSNPFGRIADGITYQNSNYCKAINNIVHDCADGVSSAAYTANNYEDHGGLSYYNGWDASDRGHGHNYYLHNDNPSTSQVNVGNCLSFASFDLGWQSYTGGMTLGNVQIAGCYVAMSGLISASNSHTAEDLLIGLTQSNETVTNSSIDTGCTYSSAAAGFGMNWGYNGTTDSCTMSNNYFAAQNTACAFHTSTNFTGVGNTYVGPSSAPIGSGTFLSWKPGSGKTIIVHSNTYEAGRANIAVYNWDHSSTVSLDFSSFLNNGDAYVVRNAWNYFGTPLTSGTWTGTNVSVNTTGLTIAAPVGLSAPSETGPEFVMYIVRKV